ncbi:hypothetical protein MBM_04343 [Drepanopeziza brunnea f. sp. 'multigermtubi' MB_m1]|uniref:Uncharacterized protein n=1 Tax=Marssonina brunnea f. sp. multigermtubi (strain MB_m1) TaxID=1072389 RepID=K1WY27_MARBU|nr:uncharacterized protein MBM_04343 [Drepanopeziza brunnea f. sp. 'multigermtubi' MB_m1]EKD17482.1 hypothetical protein MBM_04343 [Drepanopeziza brunnea f. sp. 'multigermtubi' MB_m1]
MNWENGIAPTQPFHAFSSFHTHHPPRPPPPLHTSTHQRTREQQQQQQPEQPTAYYLEQAALYAPNLGPDPFAAAAAAEQAPPPPRRPLRQALGACTAVLTQPLYSRGASALRRTSTTTAATILRAGAGAGGVWRRDGFELGALAALVVVNQALGYLPGWAGKELLVRDVLDGVVGGGGGGGREGGAVVYKIWLSAGRQAIGTGPVCQAGA